MLIKVNNESKEVATDLTVVKLVQALDLVERTGIAIAVNDTIISKQSWESHVLKERDDVLIITATQGG